MKGRKRGGECGKERRNGKGEKKESGKIMERVVKEDGGRKGNKI